MRGAEVKAGRKPSMSITRRAACLGIGVVALSAITFSLNRNIDASVRAAEALVGKTSDPAGTLDPVTRGKYLASAGDCIGCHQARGSAPFAGGLGVPTPFGKIYTSNITPDRETGIGSWSADDFWRAVHDGKGKNGEYLYPAFPFTNYARITRADSDALYAWFMSLPPIRRANTPNELRFPYNQRFLLAGWRLFFFHEKTFEPDAAQSVEWNRGAYLATGLGHCVACHSPRNALGATKRSDELAGGLIPVQNWYAPSLTSNNEAGLGKWRVDEIVQLLKTGVTPRSAVFGPMSEVVHDSTQHLTESDLRAMAVYLKSLPARVIDDAPPVKTTESQSAKFFEQGAAIYRQRCTDCHRASGEGVALAYPPLDNNPAIIMDSAINAIRVVLNGGFPPGTAGNPRPYGMPPFAQQLNDEEVASVLTFVRRSWSNRAPAVSPADVSRYRAAPVE